MTVSVHKVIDDLINRKHNDMGGVLTFEEGFLESFIDKFNTCECFDFGDLVLEKDEAPVSPVGNPSGFCTSRSILNNSDSVVSDGIFVVPQLTEDERGFWKDGLIPMPAPYCWFEFRFSGGSKHRSALFVESNPFCVYRTDTDSSDGVFFDGVGAQPVDGDLSKLSLVGNTRLLDLLDASGTGEASEHLSKEFVKLNYASNVPLAVYLLLMINSKSTEIVKEKAPAKLNKARIKNGRSPLRDHTVVTIVPKKYRTLSENEVSGTHKSPRLHWRRSHLRTVRKDGEALKRIVIPRCLVGKRELGEVSHEYTVRR